MPGILDFLQGKNQSIQNIPRFSPEQMNFQNQALQMAQQGLGTDAIENKARAGFQRETIPQLSERFANIGGRGLSGIGSSGYQNALQGAGTELELGLADLRQRNAMNLANIGLTPQNEQVLEREQPGGFGQSLLTGLAGSAPQLAELGYRGLSSYFGNKGQGQPGANNASSPSGSSTAGNIASAVGGIGGVASTLASSGAAGSAGAGGGLLSGIGSAATAAAPFALPLAGAAAVIALPFLLSYLLED